MMRLYGTASRKGPCASPCCRPMWRGIASCDPFGLQFAGLTGGGLSTRSAIASSAVRQGASRHRLAWRQSRPPRRYVGGGRFRTSVGSSIADMGPCRYPAIPCVVFISRTASISSETTAIAQERCHETGDG